MTGGKRVQVRDVFWKRKRNLQRDKLQYCGALNHRERGCTEALHLLKEDFFYFFA